MRSTNQPHLLLRNILLAEGWVAGCLVAEAHGPTASGRKKVLALWRLSSATKANDMGLKQAGKKRLQHCGG
jgi:hypothetical protein